MKIQSRDGARLSAPLVLLACLTILIVSSGGAHAQSAWGGSGSATLTSTPSPYGACTGSGTSQLALSGPSSSLYGTLTIDISSYTSGCSGFFSTGPIVDSVQGSDYSGALTLSDGYGDSISGTLNAGSLSLTLTEPPPTASGGSCATFCHTVISMGMTGGGDIGGTGGFGSGSLDFGNASTAFAATGLVFGLLGIGLAAASGSGRSSGTARGTAPLRGIARGNLGGGPGGARYGPIQSTNPLYGPAPETMVGNPPTSPPQMGVPEGEAITGGGAGVGPGVTPSPQIYVGYTFCWSINGVPINPETGQPAIPMNGPDGPRQYFNQTTGKWYRSFAPL